MNSKHLAQADRNCSAIQAEMEHQIYRRRVKKEGRGKSCKDKEDPLGSSGLEPS